MQLLQKFSLRRFSLTNRLLTIATVALFIALGLIGIVMDRAFKEKTMHLVKERLEGYIFALISVIETTEDNKLKVHETLPIPKLTQPVSGIYAQINSEDFNWQSISMFGVDLPLPQKLATGVTTFNLPLKYQGKDYFRMTKGLVFEAMNKDIPFILSVSEDAKNYFRELHEFQDYLWMWLLLTSIILLGIQGLIMNWSLRPLKRLTANLMDLEKGKIDTVSDDYPPELAGLTTNLNRLLENERGNLNRQRKTLGDLAHSLKTPLAIIHSELENSGDTNKNLISEQVRSMNDIVEYQLKRAAVAGHRTFTVGIPVIDKLEQIIRTLDKVYRNKKVIVHLQIAPGAEFYGEHGDLMELLGNLLENAYKWCDQNISVIIKTLTLLNRKRTGLIIEIADDGPGISQEKRSRLLERGVRGDEKVTGHGIGLSIVNDIVESYQGSIEIKYHALLTGAHFIITLPP
ncbi:Sensor histidine kinase PhoQ [hydrothermal vent metagenome]|uniref:histidine kinase n=1 Tax=hydrothermal vent metagenome TaxID=652676 RepID=A0A3B0V817_9ZZZZ